MTEKVVDIRSRQPHMEGKCVCLNCRHEWVGVAEIGTGPIALECPKCDTFKGVWYGIALPEGPIWQCDCGNCYFFVDQLYAYCCHCGLAHEPWKPQDNG